MYTLYSMQNSGNCYKPRLAMAQLGIPFNLVDVDSLDGSTRKAEYLVKNPNGKVPLLEWPVGRFLAESNAMLLHLADGTELIPYDGYERALVWQWMFFEQYSHEPYIAVARSWLHVVPGGRAQAGDKVIEWHEKGHKALAVMEEHLSRYAWFSGPAYGVADIALYAYTHVAHQGDFDMSAYVRIGDWLNRVAATPGFVPLAWRPSA